MPTIGYDSLDGFLAALDGGVIPPASAPYVPRDMLDRAGREPEIGTHALAAGVELRVSAAGGPWVIVDLER